MPEFSSQPAGKNPSPPQRKRKKKKQSRLKLVLSSVGLCVGLFAAVSLLTFAALSLKDSGQNNPEQGSLAVIEASQIPSSSAATETTAYSTETTFSTDITELTTELTTEDTTETTTISTRYIPGEDEYPYFTRSYTYPHEAQPTTSSATTSHTTVQPPHSSAQQVYSAYGNALKYFLQNADELSSNPMYALTDLNGDGTPELIISGGTSPEARHTIYAYINGTLSEMESANGETFGHLYLPDEDDPQILIEICETESGTDTFYYEFDGKKLNLLHAFRDAGGSYYIDGDPAEADEYTAAMYVKAKKDAGREYSLPASAEELTEIGGYPV